MFLECLSDNTRHNVQPNLSFILGRYEIRFLRSSLNVSAKGNSITINRGRFCASEAKTRVGLAHQTDVAGGWCGLFPGYLSCDSGMPSDQPDRRHGSATVSYTHLTLPTKA